MNNNMDLNCNEHLIQEHPPPKNPGIWNHNGVSKILALTFIYITVQWHAVFHT